MGVYRLPIGASVEGTATRLASIIVLIVLAVVLLSSIASAYTNFEVVSYSWTSRTGHSVYPGSNGATLIVNVKYDGNSTLEDVSACLQLPPGFRATGLYGACSPAFKNDTIASVVKPGDVITFRYQINVATNVTPGDYYALLTISYYNATSGAQGAAGPFGLKLVISRYPPLNIALVEVYWEPGAYTGIQGATLHVVLKFYGSEDNRLLGGLAYLRFSSPELFRPSSFRVRIGGAQHGDNIYIDLSGVSIKPSAKPGSYRLYIEIRATAETSDGVRYTASETLVAVFQVAEPPPITLRILDYGFEGIVEPGSRDASIYITLLQYEPGVRIRGFVAEASFEGSSLYNGSRRAVYTATLDAGYGDTFTIRYNGLSVESERTIVHLHLYLLVDEDGSLYWVDASYNLTLVARRHPFNVTINGVWWGSEIAHPGSSSLTLYVQLANLDYRDVRGGVATLILPKGFQPANITIQLPALRHGETVVIAFRGISVDYGLQGGFYPARLVLRFIGSSGNAFREYSLKAILLLHIEHLLRPPLSLASIGWVGGVAFTGESGASLEATLYNNLPGYRVESAHARLVLPACIEYGDSRVVNATLSSPLDYGSYSTLRIDGVRVVCRRPGVYPVAIVVEGLVSRGEAETWFNETLVGYLLVSKPRIRFVLFSYEWLEGGYVGSKGSRLRLNLVYLSPWRLASLAVTVYALNGSLLERGPVTTTYTGVEYGDVISIDVGGLDVRAENITFLVKAAGVVSIGSGRTTVNTEILVHVEARNTSITRNALIVTGVSILYNGQPAIIVPGARGDVVRVYLLNQAPYRIASVSAMLRIPYASVKSVEGSCLGGVAPGSQCYIDFVVWVDRGAPPGLYNATLELLYSIVEGSSVTLQRETLDIPLRVEPLTSVTPQLLVASAYWANGGLPYPESGVTRVNIVILNLGRWEARGVHGELVVLEPRGVKSIASSAVCASPIAPGSSCTMTFTLLLGRFNSISITARLVLSQLVTTYGANTVVTRVYTIRLPVARPPLPMITVGQHGWLNGWHVFPGTSNAVYTVVVGNTYPLPLSGITAWIEAPGISSKRVYASGPIQPYSSVELRIPVNVTRRVKPGIINATLVLVYTVASNGVEWRHVTLTPLEMRIDDVEDAVKLVEAYWVGGAVRSGMAGVHLRIVLRNNLVSQMRGAIIYVHLPQGFQYTLLNATVAVAVPGESHQSQSPLGGPPVPEAQLARLILSQGGFEAMLPSIPLGSFIVADTVLNLGRVKPGYYNMTLVLDFIDDWGTRHRWFGRVEVYVAGAPKLLLVETPAALEVANGVASMTIRVINIGSGPVMDAYLYVIPRVPLLVPNQTVFYLGVLHANESKVLNVTLYYNPTGLSTWGSSTARYSTIVFTYTIVYRDANGVLHVYNFTRGTQLLPFIEVRLGADTRAEQRGSRVIVGGTVLNTGIATAHSVTIEVIAGKHHGSTFIGDLDPGDQSAFQVEVGVEGRVDRVKLVMRYLDNYGREYTVNYTLPVYHPPPPATPVTTKRSTLLDNVLRATLIVAPLVAVATGYLLLRVYRERRRIEG